MSLQQLNGLARICPGAMLVVLMIATVGFAGVKVNAVDNRDYLSLRRGDALKRPLCKESRTAGHVGNVVKELYGGKDSELTRNGFHNIAWGKRLSDSEGAPRQVS